MAIPFDIPNELKEFAPILEWFSNVPEEELNEDLDQSHIVSFLRSRYGDLDIDDFERRLKSDRRAFDKLVEAEGTQHLWLHFLGTYLLMAPHLLADSEPTAVDESLLLPPLILHVKLPKHFDIENDYGAIRARNDNFDIELVPTAESALEFRLKNLRQQDDWKANRQQPRYSFAAVNWTSISGWKVETGARSDSKYVQYLLKVPGGACFVDVRCKHAHADESLLEEYLRTATVETTTQM